MSEEVYENPFLLGRKKPVMKSKIPSVVIHEIDEEDVNALRSKLKKLSKNYASSTITLNQVIESVNNMATDLNKVITFQKQFQEVMKTHKESLEEHEALLTTHTKMLTSHDGTLSKVQSSWTDVVTEGEKMVFSLNSRLKEICQDISIIKSNSSTVVVDEAESLEKENQALKRKIQELESQKNADPIPKKAHQDNESIATEKVQEYLRKACDGQDTCLNWRDSLSIIRDIAHQNGVYLATNTATFTWLKRKFEGIESKTDKKKKQLFIPKSAM